jgi:hypothetical protein
MFKEIGKMLNSLDKFSDDFMSERKQPKTQVREAL